MSLKMRSDQINPIEKKKDELRYIMKNVNVSHFIVSYSVYTQHMPQEDIDPHGS